LRFQIVAPLGSGGFGSVYEAIDARSGQHVALKELGDVSASSIARFKQEFRALSDFHHPNLVGLKELIEEEERWLIVMELVPGSDFLSFVRGGADNTNQPYDDARVRHALLGIANGLTALHRYGVLHRDLKPSNVRVTPDGRAVLLDFGLITSVDPTLQSTHAGGVGTVAYMAPEQATSANVGPSADWYAVGVCLFEALTGRRPFEGQTAFQILADKQQLTAPRASSLVPNVPADLDQLCALLLERLPEQRATASDVLAMLGARDASSFDGALLARSAPAQAPFAGRAAELLQLARAFQRTHDGALKLVLVEGESGVGKSELVAEFLRRARAEKPGLLALQGRCYENEQVSYKAFDGCIDELSRFLHRLAEPACAQLLPPRATLLGQLFPVLRTVRAIAKAPRGEPSADPTARRLEGFAALAALLSKLAEERPVVLVIDDLQWADAESFRLLLALAEHPEPPPVLIVATIRPPEELDPSVAAGLEALRRKQRIDVVQMLGLPAEEAAALARRLLGDAVPEHYCQMIAAESGGHPLFLSELVQFVESHDLGARGALTLEAALRSRIERLDERARGLLEIAALAGRPQGSHILARALGVESVDEPARTLLAAKLLRVRKGQELGCYHDRIRHTAVVLIARSRLSALHRQIAHALSSDPLGDAIEQARHWDLGGDDQRAIDAYERAAEAALAALAFMRAAELCARAIRLVGNDRDPRSQRLLVKHAHALACAGRSAEAAVLYEQAVGRASAHEQPELRVRHAQQLILCGKLEVGITAMRSLLSERGINLPSSTLGTVLQIVWYRLWLALRGDHFVTRAARPGEEQHMITTDVLSTFMNAISPLHPLAIMLLTLRATRHVARVPVPEMMSQLYAALGWFRALGGSPSAAHALFAKSRETAAQINSPVALAKIEFVEGSSHILNWDYKSAAISLERAQHLLQTRCPDEPSLLRNVRYHLGMVWYALGTHGRIAHETDRWIVEARERNDQLAVALLTGIGNGFFRQLMRDAPDAALRELEDAIREMPKEPFSFIHLGQLVGTVNTLLYKGGPAAFDWLEARAAAHKRPLLLRSPLGRQALGLYGGQAALHALESRGEKARTMLLDRARKHGKTLARARSTNMRIYGALLLAQVHVFEGRPAQALAAARHASALASDHHDLLSSLFARYFEALLESGTASDPRCIGVVAHFRAQGWRDPLAFLRGQLPALHLLVPRSAPAGASRQLLLGRYEVVRTLGAGGFGTVVEARDVQTGRAIALKELISTSPRALERFKQEFRALRDIHHTSLVRLDALLEESGTWYIAMELLQGEKLLAHARASLDSGRICALFEALAAGLAALHEAGFAHRDVTPDNVRVTADGRAVLLDFGSIGRLGDARDEEPVGRVEYAAPEQLAGAPPSTGADVYALGSCLYEVLSGNPPFLGETPAIVLQRKQREPPAPIAARGLEPFARLSLQMLATEPSDRPSLAELRAHLQTLASATPPASVPPSHVEHHGHFAGREHELARLGDGFERTCDDGLQLMLVEGESGLGKSALVAEFARQVAARSPNTLVLRSRCYENELVAFKAFDGAVDQLARALRELPNPTCEALLPKRAALLLQLFPVLKSVQAIAQSPKKGLPADPGARQRAASACFVQLLERLTNHFELLLLVDDLQWADSESFRLLRTLLEGRKALPLLIVCTVRPTNEVSPEVAAELRGLRTSEATESFALAGLSDAAARRLLQQLHGAQPDGERIAQLLREAKGHPLFLRELIEQQRSGGAATLGNLTLDHALRARIQSLDESARALLSLVALAGKPYGTHVFARALRAPEPPRAALVALLGQGLLRRAGDNALTAYHDRIARAALELLTSQQRRALARELAAALDLEPGADPSERARLWDEGGEAERACVAYDEAGDRALEALQFTRAAQHYGRALELLNDTRGEQARSLLARRGLALARAGRSAEAAHAYAAAALAAVGESAVRLRILAAEQSIQSAQAESGVASARALLAELGIAAPTTPSAALARLAWNRGRIALRGYNLRRPRGAVAAKTRMQLDAAWSLALPLSWLDPLAGAALTSDHLRLALASGEPTHVARALAAEAFARVVRIPDDRKIDGLLARARALASEHGDPALEAEITYREGVVATYRWNLTLASERLEHALASATERCPDQPWLLTNIRLALGSVWTNRSEHARLAAASAGWLAEARDRGDQFALTTLNGLGYAFIPRLMADDPDAVDAELASRRTLWPREPFSFVHLGDLLAAQYQLLYRGGDRALSFQERELPRLSRALLLRTGTGRSSFLFMRATAVLAAWSVGDRAQTPALLSEARQLVAELARVRSAFAAHTAALLSAQIDAVSGARDRAMSAARAVHAAAVASGYAMHAHRARYLEAVLEGGKAGRKRRVRLLALYAGQGWKQPRRALTLLCPILDVLESDAAELGALRFKP
jgi:serine/threonine protein kinase/predicted ATPase